MGRGEIGGGGGEREGGEVGRDGVGEGEVLHCFMEPDKKKRDTEG